MNEIILDIQTKYTAYHYKNITPDISKVNDPIWAEFDILMCFHPWILEMLCISFVSVQLEIDLRSDDNVWVAITWYSVIHERFLIKILDDDIKHHQCETYYASQRTIYPKCTYKETLVIAKNHFVYIRHNTRYTLGTSILFSELL